MLKCLILQLREERRAAKAAAAADAKRTLRRETEWMRRQPKARSTKAAARVKQFYELTAAARDVPQAEVSVDFDNELNMKRQVGVLWLCLLSYHTVFSPRHSFFFKRQDLLKQEGKRKRLIKEKWWIPYALQDAKAGPGFVDCRARRCWN